MCGIVGYIGLDSAADVLVEGLKTLEYRGYDSAGVAIIGASGLQRERAEGKLKNLAAKLRAAPLAGNLGIGHTRWATHGKPNETNAHPHRSGSVAVVHNGIIENYASLRSELQAAGAVFVSETDTEVVAHLVGSLRAEGLDLRASVEAAIKRLEGAYAIAVVDENFPDELVAARLSSPLILALGEGENLVASDLPAVLAHTRNVVFLEDGDLAHLRRDGVDIYAKGLLVERPVKRIDWSPAAAQKGGYKHFMLKEIFEQPRAVGDTLSGRLGQRGEVHLEHFDLAATAGVEHISLVACGTSWHAALIGRDLIENIAGIPVSVEYAHEYRYRRHLLGAGDLVIGISQSGETADTLAALTEVKKQGVRVGCITNVLESAAARLCADSLGVIYTHAGPEIGVASTKALTTQMVSLHLLALAFARNLERMTSDQAAAEIDDLRHLPHWMEQALESASAVADLAAYASEFDNYLFLGRGTLFPVALEGALKLKEISYLHAEGYASGEMKHGPIALITDRFPTVALVGADALKAKAISNIQEIKARGGPVIIVASEGDEDLASLADKLILVPKVPARLQPVIYSLPMQLLAYYVADHLGTDVDQPRNLAKSVTVE
jgi:glucosamine--fructose-6-phosphate aminotransferase (isomerizing)